MVFASGGPAGGVLFFSVKRKEPKENQLIPRCNAGISWFFLLLGKVDGLPVMCFSGGFGRGFSQKSRPYFSFQ
jgi:hypothetical protein